MRGYLLGNRFEQDLQLPVLPFSPFRKSIRRRFARDLAVRDRQPEHLRETRLSRTEESRHPDGDTFMRLVGSFPVEIENVCVMGSYCAGDYILVDFIPEY